MQVEEAIGERDIPVLVVSGFGAQRILSRECGLHLLEIADGGNGSLRTAARVRVAVTPLEDMPAVKMHAAIARAFEQANPPSAVVRRYRAGPSPLVRNADGSWQKTYGLVEGQEQNNPGPFTTVGCAGVGNALQLVGLTK